MRRTTGASALCLLLAGSVGWEGVKGALREGRTGRPFREDALRPPCQRTLPTGASSCPSRSPAPSATGRPGAGRPVRGAPDATPRLRREPRRPRVAVAARALGHGRHGGHRGERGEIWFRARLSPLFDFSIPSPAQAPPKNSSSSCCSEASPASIAFERRAASRSMASARGTRRGGCCCPSARLTMPSAMSMAAANSSTS
jgi:hypothetical protein